MLIVGLTGSVAMGKSKAALAFRRLGVPVHDADAAVRRLLAKDTAAIARIAEAFPGAVRNGVADRAFLAARVFADTAALRGLEAILHPPVRRLTRKFLALAARRREKIVVLDIPLLFETGGERGCDLVVVVDAPAFVQAKRFLARPGMTRERLAATRARQTPAREKFRRADAVIRTGLDRGFSFRRVAAIVAWARGPAGRRANKRRAWNPGWL
ncbi:MAG: dephospho-CoA kinase [Pseudomonadota bacterium]